MARRVQPVERERDVAIRRLHRLAEDMHIGVNCVAALHDAASGFAGADRRLQRLERALSSLLRGDVLASVDVDKELVQLVKRIRNTVRSWQHSGKGAAKLTADTKRLLRALTRAPPRKSSLCSMCQEKLPFLGGRAGGGICVDCIRVAYKALVEAGI